MEWKLVLSTFGITFLAELGDKTQLAAISLTASTQRPWSVFFGTSAALVTVSALGVMVGAALSQVIPFEIVHKIAAFGFVAVGVAMLLDWI